jgi:transposase
MERFIGIDVHSASCTVAVVGPSGKRLRCDVVDTSAKTLIQYLQGIAGNKRVCIEEGTQAEWLYEVLSPHVAEVVVMNVRGMAATENKSDAADAFTRAEDLRLGRIKSRVYKERGAFGALPAVAKVYDRLVADHVRTQHRLKAMFRSRGIKVADKTYPAHEQKRLLKALPMYQREATEMLFAQFEAMSETRQQAEEALITEAKKHAMTRVLMTVPGLGIKRAAQIQAVVVDPHRFRSKRQFWSYCGFGIQTHTSAEWAFVDGQRRRVKQPLARGLNRARNATLKNVFNGAAETVIMQVNKKEPLHQDYLRLIEAGTKPDLARLTIARKIAALSLAMWKKKEAYNPEAYRSEPESSDE